MVIEGVLSLVIPSELLAPESEAATINADLLADGAVVSIVMENCSDAATIRPPISWRARYFQVPSARFEDVHDSAEFCGIRLQTTFADPSLVNVTVVSTEGTSSPRTTVGVESDNGTSFMESGILAVIPRTEISPLEVAAKFAW